MNAKLCCQLFAGAVLVLLCTASAQSQNKALDPVDRTEESWVKRHTDDVEKMNQGDIEFLLVGDSITNGWDGQKELYEKFFSKFKPINLGIGGDQTAHVLWRLDNLPLDKIDPKVAMVMIGTNNIGHGNGTTPAETVQGIVAIVDKLQKKYPQMQIIVLNVFPRSEKPNDPLRNKVNEINAGLPDVLKGKPNVKLVNINAGFLDEDGILPKSLMNDFLHPGKEGYEYWGNTIVPEIEEAFRRYDQPQTQTSPRKERQRRGIRR